MESAAVAAAAAVAEKRKAMLRRLFDLEYKICQWSVTNSQSNPGAVMELKSWKTERQKIIKELGIKFDREQYYI